MFNDDPYGSVKRLLGQRSSRGLVRSLRDLSGNGATTVIDEAASQYDPTRFRGAFKDEAAQLGADAAVAQQLNQRDTLEQQVRNPALDPAKRDMMQQTLDRLPKYGSAAARFDPRDQNSAASRFGNRRTLFRNI